MKTTQELLVQLQQMAIEQYTAEIARLPFKPAVRAALIDGFKDGVRSGVHHTVKMLGVEVVKE